MNVVLLHASEEWRQEFLRKSQNGIVIVHQKDGTNSFTQLTNLAFLQNVVGAIHFLDLVHLTVNKIFSGNSLLIYFCFSFPLDDSIFGFLGRYLFIQLRIAC